MHIQNNDITPETCHNYIRLPITNKFHFLTLFCGVQKSCSKLMIFVSLPLKKIIFPYFYRAPFFTVYPLNLTYILLIPWLLL